MTRMTWEEFSQAFDEAFAELMVVEVFGQDDAQHAGQQGRIFTGNRLQVQVGLLGELGLARSRQSGEQQREIGRQLRAGGASEGGFRATPCMLWKRPPASRLCPLCPHSK
mgnify:CR=1 FL=1